MWQFQPKIKFISDKRENLMIKRFAGYIALDVIRLMKEFSQTSPLIQL